MDYPTDSIPKLVHDRMRLVHRACGYFYDIVGDLDYVHLAGRELLIAGVHAGR